MVKRHDDPTGGGRAQGRQTSWHARSPVKERLSGPRAMTLGRVSAVSYDKVENYLNKKSKSGNA